MKNAFDKTNALRQVENAGIPVKPHLYDVGDGRIDGCSMAEKIGLPPERVFKTLVTVSADREHLVFVIPVNRELDLKLAAKVAGTKKVEMILQKELLPLTGYRHGGCSPVGMKKMFRTFIDEAAAGFDDIAVSAGRIGLAMELPVSALAELKQAHLAKLTSGN